MKWVKIEQGHIWRC